jgi:hypothetical protein
MKVIQRKDGAYAVLSENDEIIIQYGKYDWIDNYYLGYARVKHGKETNGNKHANVKWGIIDENGTEVVPAIYDDIHNFIGTNNSYVTICHEEMEFIFYFSTKEFVRKL